MNLVCSCFFHLSRLACGAQLCPKSTCCSLNLWFSFLCVTNIWARDMKTVIMEMSPALKKRACCCNSLPSSRCWSRSHLGFPVGHGSCSKCQMTLKGGLQGRTPGRLLLAELQGRSEGNWQGNEAWCNLLQECLQPASVRLEMLRLEPDVLLSKKKSNKPRHLLQTGNEQTKPWVYNK